MISQDKAKKAREAVFGGGGFATRQRRLHAPVWRPPYLTGGGAETAAAVSAEQEAFEKYTHFLTDSKGRLLEIPLRRGKADSAFIDQISFSIHEDTLSLLAGYPLVSDDEYIVRASMALNDIFGFGITEKAKHTGGRFYDSCWLMGTDNAQYGRVHFGGQNNTMLIELTATGCNAASDGWESRLYRFITQAVRPKITRIDIAKDFFNGEYTPEQAKADRLAGKFTNHRMMPDGESVGTDWESNNGKGKTYYVGSRESSKYVRVYEKGKQLGDKQSPWVRFEIEFKAKDIVIPFEVLTVPGEYFGGAYPICSQFQEKAQRIETVKKVLDLTFERCIEVARNQVGRAINAAKSMFPNKQPAEILAMFEPEHDLLPKRLSMENYAAKFNHAPAVHEDEGRLKPGESAQMLVEMALEQKRKMTKLISDKHEEDYLAWAYHQYSGKF
ncbi:replication initiation factor domain-containing protein [Neisseria musculi]|uniref:Replication initiation factor family protein n=2 Tax=Neisseria musculi TaxID=1815583 RepID=A0A7H1MDJ4_9NEIS|nr:replication initiation factor domain-containing protein [Neisseria musculi]QNT58748.1 replication initiation factor family protein [Neisseria musculi]QNT58968.1 replication initiation factor family protein [Neisseria musculi]QNT59709.1 replication initiation factor family protein [Neisseria musculi]QNT60336.1 replication initiation factor family protein [Neisseria musculi]